MIPDGPWNSHKIDCSEMEDSMLDFEGNLAEKRQSVRIMMPDIGSSERMKREAVLINLEMTMIDKLYQ